MCFGKRAFASAAPSVRAHGGMGCQGLTARVSPGAGAKWGIHWYHPHECFAGGNFLTWKDSFPNTVSFHSILFKLCLITAVVEGSC